MGYTRISADCHIDLPMLAPDFFTSNATPATKSRMPYVTDGPDGPYWTCRNGGSFGLLAGVGPAGQKLVPGQNYRVDVMAALRAKDMQRDGVVHDECYTNGAFPRVLCGWRDRRLTPLASGLPPRMVAGRTQTDPGVRPEEPTMPFFYAAVTTMLLISLVLLGFAETFSNLLIRTPTMSSTVDGADADRDLPE